MNVQLDLRMDKPEFLAWVQVHEGRYELAGNRVVMMTGGSRGHAILVRRLATALEKRLDGNRWAVMTSDFGVDVGPSTVTVRSDNRNLSMIVFDWKTVD